MKAWRFCIHFLFVSFILCHLFTGQVGTLMIREVSVSKQVISQVQGWIVHKPSMILKNKVETWNRLFSRWEQDLWWEDCIHPGTECLLGTRFVWLGMTVTINRLIASCVVGVDITLILYVYLLSFPKSSFIPVYTAISELWDPNLRWISFSVSIPSTH